MCNYRKVFRAESLTEVRPMAEEMVGGPGRVCLLVKVEPGNQEKVDRVAVGPEELATRLREAATGERP